MFVDLKVSEGSFIEDTSVERLACWMKSEDATREDVHQMVDDMFDAVEKLKN